MGSHMQQDMYIAWALPYPCADFAFVDLFTAETWINEPGMISHWGSYPPSGCFFGSPPGDSSRFFIPVTLEM